MFTSWLSHLTFPEDLLNCMFTGVNESRTTTKEDSGDYVTNITSDFLELLEFTFDSSRKEKTTL